MTTRIQIQDLSIGLTADIEVQIKQLVVKSNTIVGILGANGSGKTTVLKGIGGLISPSSGTRIVTGSIGWKSTQLPGYCPFWVEEVLALHPDQHAPQFVPFDPIVHFDLGHLIGRPLSKLSTGEQHRCLLARLFCRHYDSLILDEPLTGLDPHQQFQLGTALSQYKDCGGTVILASHAPDWVKSTCDTTYAVIAHHLTPINLRQMILADIHGIYTRPRITGSA